MKAPREEDLRNARLRLLEFALGHSPSEILHRTLDELDDLTSSTVAFHRSLEADQDTPALTVWSTRTLEKHTREELVRMGCQLEAAGGWAENLGQHGVFVSNTCAGLPQGHPQIDRVLAVPVMRENRIVAVVGLGNKQEDYGEADVTTASFLADVGHELAEHRRHEFDIAEQQQVFNLVYEKALAGFWDWNIPKSTLFMSRRFKAVLGYDDHEVPNTQAAWEKLVHPDDLPAVFERYRQHVASRAEVPYQLEVRYLHRSGGIVWVSCTGTIMEWSRDGGPVRMVGCHADITEKKRTEEALRRAREETEDLYDNAPCGYHSVDTQGRIVRVNATEASLLGYSKEELIGRRISEFQDPESARIEARDLPDFFKTGGTIAGKEVTFVRRDGTVLPVLLSATGIRSETGAVIASRTTFVDISERKQMERDLEAARDSAEAANRAKSAFLASMSHEIRTPMNAVLGFTQLLLRDPTTTAAQSQILEGISRAGNHLMTLIDDILQIAKIEAGRITLRETTFDPSGLLRDIDSLFRERARAKRLELVTEQAADLPRAIVADEGKLRQVLANLLSNAVKFTAAGRITIRATVQQRGGGRRLVLEVEDTGPGISMEEKPRLFRKFEQGESGRRSGTGTGLGLAISRELILLMGGEISVQSDPGRGSVFRVELPLKLGAQRKPQKTEARRIRGLKTGQPPVRVLVADDSEDNRVFLAKLLNRTGFETLQAANGEQAVQAFRAWKPHLILMDMRMPIVDGAEAICRIRTAGGPTVKIISVTAGAFEEDRMSADASGADAFLSKPFAAADLLEKIGKLLGVEYDYADTAGEPAAPGSGSAAELTPEALAALPAELLAGLRKATLSGDLDRVLDLASRVEAYSVPIASMLRTLGEKFAYQRILDLLAPGDKEQ